MTLRIDNALFGKLFALLCGAVLPFAFAPYGYYPIAGLALASLFYLCFNVKPREAFIRAYLFGFACFGIGVNWLHISINLFGGVNLAGALFFTYLLVAFLALYPALCTWLAVRFFKNLALYALPFLWLLTEWLRGWFLTGFPWLNVGTSQTDSLLASYAPIIGDYGISLSIALLAMALVVVLTGKTMAKGLAMLSIFAILGIAMVLKPVTWTAASETELDVALIQGAIPQKIKWNRDQRQPTLEIYSELTRPYWNSDLIIWPETAIPSLYHLADDFIQRINKEKQDSDALFLSGLAYKDPQSGNYFNSILLIDNDVHRFYHKYQLVPFGEYLPLKPILGRLLRFLQIPMSDFSSGDASMKTLITEQGVFGMSICYEDAYAKEIRKSMPKANLLINVSNDAWFGDSLAPHQHLQIARMRALENGRYLLRATNTGISAIIDERGIIRQQSPQFVAHALAGRVQLFSGATPYSQWGNLPLLAVVLLVLLILLSLPRFKN